MKRNRVTYLLLFAGLILVLSSCHPRSVSDIKKNMTKAEVVALWGGTPLITSKTANDKTTETWEYHFMNSGSVCWVDFSQDRVVASQCAPMRGPGYTYYSYNQPRQSTSTPPGLGREGSFAMRLAEALKLGQPKSEAEAGGMLASAGIAPRNGWVADAPLLPDMIGGLHNSVGAAADSGKLAMKKDEALKAFEDVVIDIENQYARVEPAPGDQPPPQPYYYSYPYPYPYAPYYPYPYYYGGGYYRFYVPFHRHRR